jgi:hypothetical protein
MIEPPPELIDTSWDIIPNVLALLVFTMTLLFIFIYARYSNWTKTAPGTALMLWAVTFDVLILMNTIHLATGRYPGIVAVRILVYGLVLLSVSYLVYALIHILRDGQPITLSTFFIDSSEKGKLMAEHEAESATIWFKNKRVWRTIFSNILTLLTVAPVVLGIVNEQYPAEWLLAAAAQAVAVQGIITRIMAIDQVNLWLSHFGLGSAPRSELIDAGTAGNGPSTITTVL